MWGPPLQQIKSGTHSVSVTHVIILDGTMSSLTEGRETNAGHVFKLLQEVGESLELSVYYEPGIQWYDWRTTWDVMVGHGINRQIRRAYGYLASRYRPGDKIVLVGFSRGAYAVRSLAGMVDQIGLLQREHATVRNIRTAYRHYESRSASDVWRAFYGTHCHADTPIEVIGVWDTVKALGLRLPFLWRITEKKHLFHSHRLGQNVRYGFHALALDETRRAYVPVKWETRPDWRGVRMEQVWFKGTHGDVGGQIGSHVVDRGLANIPLNWMLGRLDQCGVPLPRDWRWRFVENANALSTGNWRGLSVMFLSRKRRRVGLDPSEGIHPLAVEMRRGVRRLSQVRVVD
jgi:uncharacterized protein (DUF2235 family)